VTGTGPRRHRPSGEPPHAAKQQEDSENTQHLGSRRPPDYVIVAASPWVKERFPAARANLWDALQAGKDADRDPEPDRKAEP
jgi:hypothetical protein